MTKSWKIQIALSNEDDLHKGESTFKTLRKDLKKDDALDEIELLRGQIIELVKELDVVEIHGGKSIDKSNYVLLLLLLDKIRNHPSIYFPFLVCYSFLFFKICEMGNANLILTRIFP